MTREAAQARIMAMMIDGGLSSAQAAELWGEATRPLTKTERNRHWRKNKGTRLSHNRDESVPPNEKDKRVPLRTKKQTISINRSTEVGRKSPHSPSYSPLRKQALEEVEEVVIDYKSPTASPTGMKVYRASDGSIRTGFDAAGNFTSRDGLKISDAAIQKLQAECPGYDVPGQVWHGANEMFKHISKDNRWAKIVHHIRSRWADKTAANEKAQQRRQAKAKAAMTPEEKRRAAVEEDMEHQRKISALWGSVH